MSNPVPMLLVSVFDTVANIYHPPFVAPTEGAAIRTIVQACSQPGHLRDHFHDYRFFVIGTFADGRVGSLPGKALTVPPPYDGRPRLSPEELAEELAKESNLPVLSLQEGN